MTDAHTTTRTYDAIVIGSGQGGKPLALALAKAGRRTALVERAHVGGTCINVGCTPTKTMVASARAAWLARRAGTYGVSIGGEIGVDLGAVRRRKQGIVEAFRNGSQARLEKTPGLDLVFGEAAFAGPPGDATFTGRADGATRTGPRTVEVRLRSGGTALLVSRTIVVNTGCRPADPGVPGLDRASVLDSTSIMELDEIPSRLLVIGGGYVGLEFGQMFRRFGSEVVIVQRGAQLLNREDPDVASEIAAILRDEGVEVLVETKAFEGGTAPGGGRWLRVNVKGPGGEEERRLVGSHILAAAGRVPNTETLGLAKAGIATNERGFIVVNERLETSAPGVWAMGDVTGGPAFTHISYDDYRILKANLLERRAATTAGRLVPYAVFIDPQLGRVGLSESEARVQGRAVRVAKLPMENVARAIEVGETRGFLKAVLDAETDEILGFTALGLEGGEIMAMVEIAMMGRITWPVLKEAIFAHPTLAESLNNLFLTLEE